MSAMMTEIGNASSSTVEQSQNEENQSAITHLLYTVTDYVWYIVPPLILLFGNFGNIMIILIMNKAKSDEAVIDIYFVALAGVDLVSLDIMLLWYWIGTVFGYHIYDQNDVICKIHNWTVGCTTSGGWILVCLTFHRAISVVWPHRVGALCTRRLVTGVILGITGIFALIYGHYLYGYHLQYVDTIGGYRCQMKSGGYMHFVSEVFTYIDLVLYSLLPSTCMVGANCVLVWNLRATLQTVHQNYAEKESVLARVKATNSVTMTVILVSVAYIVLTLPVAVFYISMFIFDPSADMSVMEHANSQLIRAVTFMLMFGNAAVNFYLYCLTGKKFRREFVSMFFHQ